MNGVDFWTNFAANAASDVMVAIVFGFFISNYVNQKIARSDRERHAKEEQLSQRKKARRYLQILKKEIEFLSDSLPRQKQDFNETGWGRAIQIDTPFWDVIDRSGELPQLLHPNMTAYLAEFYQHLANARRGNELVIQCWLIPNADTVPGMDLKLDAFIQMTNRGVDNAMVNVGRMLEHIQDNIAVLDSQIGLLKTELNLNETQRGKRKFLFSFKKTRA